MGLLNLFRRKKRKDESNVAEQTPSEWYVLQGREIGSKRWITYGEGDEFPNIDDLEEQGIFVPGYEYRIIKIVGTPDGKKKREELWRKSFGEPVAKAKAKEVSVNESEDEPIIQINTKKLRSLAQQVRELREISQEIQSIFNFGDNRQQLPGDMYEGKLPVWMHPQVADSLGKMLGSLVGGMLGGATNQAKGGNKKGSTLDEIDSELED